MELKRFIRNYFSHEVSVLTGIVIITITGVLYYNSETTSVMKVKEETLKAISNLKLNQVISWKNERLGDAYVLAESPLFIAAVKSWSMNRTDTRLKKLITRRLSAFRRAFEYENLFIISPQGELLITVDAGMKNPEEVTLQYAREAIAEKRILYTDFYYCRLHSGIHFDILTPLVSDSGNIFALLVLRINPHQYIYPLIQSWPVSSVSAETLLVKKDGDYALFLNMLRHNKADVLSFRLPLSMKSLPAARAIMGESGFIKGIDYRGKEVLSVIRKIPDTEWFIITKIDKDEIYSDLYYIQISIIIIMILSFITMIAALSYIYHHRETDFYKKLYLNEKALKEKQEQLAQSEIRFRKSLDDMLEGCQIIGYDWKYVYCNNAALKYYRIEDPVISGKNLIECYPDFANTELYADMQRCMNMRLSLNRDYEFTFSDNKKGFLELSIHPAPEGIFVLTLDVTERKKIERELINKCNEIESIFENMINAFVIWESVFDENGRYVSFRFGSFNNAFSEISGLKLSEVHGKDVFDVWPDTEHSWVDIYGEVALTGNSQTFDMFHNATNGFYHCNAYRPTDSMSHICVIFEDITERKKNEEEIKRGLLEKETLIRELYHRTKNNMQVIYGILAIQADKSDNNDFKSLIKETNNRIMSMSLVHQMLYKSRNLSSVNLNEYITDLIYLLVKSFDVKDRIEVRLDLEPVTVQIDTAIPCGLILNELISNVFRHAFPEWRSGFILINLRHEDDSSLAIDVMDNGVGVEDGFDYYRQKSLGLQLIISITEQQLNGTVEFFSDNGLRCSLKFREIHKNPRI